jgi:hypothetical protein
MAPNISIARDALAVIVCGLALVACGDDPIGGPSNGFQCMPGTSVPCTSCPDGRARATQCLPTGDALAECPCANPPLPMSGGTGGASGAAGAMQSGGVGGMTGGMGGTGGAGGVVSGSGGMTGGSGGMASGSGGMASGQGGMAGGQGGMAGGQGGTDDLSEVRQVCVDTINMYRATLDLEPLARATPEQETCSDGGARMDAEEGPVHGSAGMCELGGQNTCPGWPVGGFAGDTLADTLKACLEAMWDEGEPPVPRDECRGDCFQAHGHYLNMSDPRATTVGCGFYDMGSDEWWMNQNFAVDWRL